MVQRETRSMRTIIIRRAKRSVHSQRHSEKVTSCSAGMTSSPAAQNIPRRHLHLPMALIPSTPAGRRLPMCLRSPRPHRSLMRHRSPRRRRNLLHNWSRSEISRLDASGSRFPRTSQLCEVLKDGAAVFEYQSRRKADTSILLRSASLIADAFS